MKKHNLIEKFVIVSILAVCFAGATLAQAGTVTVNDVLVFFDDAVSQGTLAGRGNQPQVQSAHLKVERQFLVEANKLIERGSISLGCKSLLRAYKGSDGESRPKDHVVGEATSELSAMINRSGWEYGCPWGEGLDFEVDFLFFDLRGTAITDGNGMTIIIDGVSLPGPSYVYPEALWGEYPMYFPGDTTNIATNITYNGAGDQVNVNVVTVVFAVNTDGSNGLLINGPDEIVLILYKEVEETLNTSFQIPVQPKGLYRIIASVYHEGNLVMTKEGIFCPPDINDIE